MIWLRVFVDQQLFEHQKEIVKQTNNIAVLGKLKTRNIDGVNSTRYTHYYHLNFINSFLPGNACLEDTFRILCEVPFYKV